MAEFVWKRVSGGEVGPEESLSLERIMNWLLSRKIAEGVLESAAADEEPVGLILNHGTENVEFIRIVVREEPK